MWNETVEKIACEFAGLIRAEFDAATLCEIRARNARPEYIGSCASHDFTDANMIMAQAFETAMGRESDVASDEDAALWNAAWERARSSGFTAGVANLPVRLNGYPVIRRETHANCTSVAVDRGDCVVVATWWPDLKDSWMWGHYIYPGDGDFNATFNTVAARNSRR